MSVVDDGLELMDQVGFHVQEPWRPGSEEYLRECVSVVGCAAREDRTHEVLNLADLRRMGIDLVEFFATYGDPRAAVDAWGHHHGLLP